MHIETVKSYTIVYSLENTNPISALIMIVVVVRKTLYNRELHGDRLLTPLPPHTVCLSPHPIPFPHLFLHAVPIPSHYRVCCCCLHPYPIPAWSKNYLLFKQPQAKYDKTKRHSLPVYETSRQWWRKCLSSIANAKSKTRVPIIIIIIIFV